MAKTSTDAKNSIIYWHKMSLALKTESKAQIYIKPRHSALHEYPR